MKASTRGILTSGAAALSVGAVMVATWAPSEFMRGLQVQLPVDFAADTLPLDAGVPVEPPSDDELDSALALIEQLAPVTDGRVVTVRLDSDENPGTVTVGPPQPNATSTAEAALTGESSDDLSGPESLDEPAPQDAASDAIDNIYSISRYWANYVSLELGPWLLDWVPLGYLVSDQIYIWYPDFVLPTVDSFVYDFLDPVVNDPLNLEVWTDGISDIMSTAATGIAEGVRNEVEYIVTFGWFPIPLPPLPNFPLPGLSSSPTSAAVALTSTEAEETATEATTDGSATNGIGESAAEDATDTESVDETTEAPSQESAEEESGDATEAPAQGQPEGPGAATVEAVDESTDEIGDDSSAERASEAQDPAQGPVDDAPDAVDESDLADEAGDTDLPVDADDQSDPADQSGDEDATQDTDGSDSDDSSGDGDNASDSDSDDTATSGSDS